MRLGLLLLNLIGNAVKYINQGSIHINATINPHIIIKVTDIGIGIPDDKLLFIFERSTKVQPPSQQASYIGAGIGLHIAKPLSMR